MDRWFATALALMSAGCGTGSPAGNVAYTPDYTVFVSPAGNRFIATRSTEPGRFFISLPSLLDGNAAAASQALPPMAHFREGADAFVKALGEDCIVTQFEVLKPPTYAGSYSC